MLFEFTNEFRDQSWVEGGLRYPSYSVPSGSSIRWWAKSDPGRPYQINYHQYIDRYHLDCNFDLRDPRSLDNLKAVILKFESTMKKHGVHYNHNMFTTAKEFWGYIADRSETADDLLQGLYVSTYNIWTAITNWKYKDGSPRPGKPWKMNPNQRVLDQVDRLCKQKKTQGCILVGCKNAVMLKERKRIKQTWPHAKLRMSSGHHAKCVILDVAGELECWVGSVNFNDASWTDLMVRIPEHQAKHILTQYIKWVEQSKAWPSY